MEIKELISVINSKIDELVDVWAGEIKASEYMEHYKTLSEDELHKRGQAVYSNLISWLDSGASQNETEKYFQEVGSERLKEEFSLSEVNYAIYLLKKLLNESLCADEKLLEKINSKEAFELLSQLSNYFDLGRFFVTRGYSNELFERLEKSNKFSKDELKKIMTKDLLDDDELDSDEFIWRHV